MDRGAWQAAVYRVTQSQTWLSVFACTHASTLSRTSLVAQMVKNQPAMQETPGLIPGSVLSQEDS